MKIRNQKIVNKLKKTKSIIQLPDAILAENQDLEDLKEDTLTNIPNNEYFSILIGVFFILTGVAFLFNFLLTYFFDWGISFYDSAFIFAVLGSFIVYGIASMINRFAIRDLLYSDKSLKEKTFLLEQHYFIKGWKRKLVYFAIITFSILFLYNTLSLVFIDSEETIPSIMLFLYAVIMSFYGIIKNDKNIPYFKFILLMGGIFVVFQWFITENEINEDYDSFSQYITYDVLGFEQTYIARTNDSDITPQKEEKEFGLECNTYDGFLKKEYTEPAYAAILEGYMPYELTDHLNETYESLKQEREMRLE